MDSTPPLRGVLCQNPYTVSFASCTHPVLLTQGVGVITGTVGAGVGGHTRPVQGVGIGGTVGSGGGWVQPRT